MGSLISTFFLVALTVVLVGILGSYWLEKRVCDDPDDAPPPPTAAGAGDAWR